MAKRNKVFIDVMVNGKMEKVSVDAAKLGKQLDNVGSSAHTADRRLKGAAQASSGAGKNFSKMSQGMGGLVGIYASFAAQVFALSAAFGFLKRAADLENLRKAQTDFAASSGLAIRTLTADLQEASKGMLSFKEAAQASAIGVAKGFSGAQLEQLTTGAVKASKALGVTFDDTFSRLLRGVSKAEPELLDELGITLRLETATEAYAQAIGKSRTALTEAERSQAVFVETMRQLNSTFGDVSASGNPFVELQVTFQKIVEDITQRALPAVTSLVNIINSNAKIAAGAFAALATLIVLNLAGFGGAVRTMMGGVGKAIAFVGKKAGSAATGATKGATKKIGDFIKDKAEDLELAALFLEEKLLDVTSKLETGAQKAVQGGAKSATLGKIAGGKEVTPQALGKLKKDLARVRKEIEDTGKTASRAFAGITVQAIDEMTEEIEEFEKGLDDSEKKIPIFKKVALKALKTVQFAAGKTANGVRNIGDGFEYVRNRADKIKKFFKIGGFAITGLILVTKAINEMAEAPLRVIDTFKKMIAGVVGTIQAGLNLIIRGLNALLENSIVEKGLQAMGVNTADGIFSEFTFADGIMDKLNTLEKKVLESFGTNRQELAMVQGQFDFVKGIVAEEEKRVELAKELKNEYATLAADFGDIFGGKAGQGDFQAQMKAIASGNLLGARAALERFGTMRQDNQEAINTLIASYQAGVDGEGGITLEQFLTASAPLLNTANQLKAVEGQASEFYNQVVNSPEFKKFPLIFQEAILSGSDETVQGLQTAALTYGAGMSTLTSMGQNLRNTLGSGDPMQLQIGLQNMINQYNSLESVEDKFGTSDSRNDDAMTRFLGPNWQELMPQLQAVASELDYLNQQKSDLAIQEAALSRLPAATKATAMLQLNIEKANVALSEKEALLAQMSLRTQFDTELDRENHNLKVIQTQREIELLKEKLKIVEEEASGIGRINDTVMSSFESGMASAVTSIVNGTATIKEAFASMAQSVIQALLQIIAQMIAVKIMQTIIGMVSFSPAKTNAIDAGMGGMGAQGNMPGYQGLGSTGGPRTARYGGVFSNGKNVAGYSVGGIAKGPQAGYPAVLHGTEAVVPLPNNKSIPVDLRGTGQQNNVTVNVSVDNQGNAQQDAQASNNDAGKLGTMIAGAVQKELQNQKRAGGILSPMGVS